MSTTRIEGLDGLRAFAVLVVLGFHLWPNLLPGGFIGVDVFFVISGFLITTLLLRENASRGRIDLKNFWRRRARRLLPALFVVVTLSIATAWLVNPDLLVGIKRQALGALTFSTNWVEIIAGTDYFAGADHALFVTFWSLAVEEQFYVLWPLIIVAALALIKSRSLLAFFAAVAAAASAILMAVLFDPNASTRVYYGTDTHCFGLMMGVSLAFLFSGEPKIFQSKVWQSLRPVVGFAAVVGLSFLVALIQNESAFTFRGGLALASLLSAFAVAVLPGEDTIFTKFCRLRPLAYVGERSYGLYLWHWPVLLILAAVRSTYFPELPEWSVIIPTIIVTFAGTEASYRWIEMPIRTHGFRATWATIREKFQFHSGWRRWPGFATLLTILAVTTACLGLINAPAKSQMQLAVEAGEDAIAAQGPQPADLKPGNVISDDSSPAWPKDLEIPPGDQICAFGDSVMSGSAPALYAKFPGIYIDAKPIRQWHDAPGFMQPMIEKGTMRRVVILNYGTNAGFKEPESEAALRQILQMLGPKRRVILVNTVGYSYWVPSANETLKQISSEFPNTIVADWWSAVQGKPKLLHSDKTHPNEAGTAVYCDTIAEAMKKLGPE